MPIVKKPKQTLLDVQAHFNTLGLNPPNWKIWRCKARLLVYINECMSAFSPRIFFGTNSPLWDGPFTPLVSQHAPTCMSAAILTFASLCQSEKQSESVFFAYGSPRMTGLKSPSLQGGKAVVSSPMADCDSPSLQGGQAAISSPISGWDSPMAAQRPVDWASSPTSPGWKVPLYAKWPKDLV